MKIFGTFKLRSRVFGWVFVKNKLGFGKREKKDIQKCIFFSNRSSLGELRRRRHHPRVAGHRAGERMKMKIHLHASLVFQKLRERESNGCY